MAIRNWGYLARRSGCEIFVKATERVMEFNKTVNDRVLFSLDFRNAFNSIKLKAACFGFHFRKSAATLWLFFVLLFSA